MKDECQFAVLVGYDVNANMLALLETIDVKVLHRCVDCCS